jgi:hypothetical protein
MLPMVTVLRSNMPTMLLLLLQLLLLLYSVYNQTCKHTKGMHAHTTHASTH